jgi:thiol-disulfide isomerase/thioredoxin
MILVVILLANVASANTIDTFGIATNQSTVEFVNIFGSATGYGVGNTAVDFTVKTHGTNSDVSLYDYSGNIIVLDFFAYWCGPCKTASSELEPYIQQYYNGLGGNPAGIPVKLISINIESRYPHLTDDYIAGYGLETVWDDFGWVAFRAFSTGAIPQFAIINGVNGANYDQWEVIYLKTGYGAGSYTSFRSAIDGVVPEPCSLVLLSLGGLMLRRRRKA